MENGRTLVRVLIGLLAFLYLVCPDFFPGPIDDAAVLMLGAVLNNKLKLPKSEGVYITEE